MRIYVASSWKNEKQPLIVQRLRALNHNVYDFRNPTFYDKPLEPINNGFAWNQVDNNEIDDFDRYQKALAHESAVEGFNLDMGGLRGAQLVLLVLPCGKSAHLELGYAAGRRQRTVV